MFHFLGSFPKYYDQIEDDDDGKDHGDNKDEEMSICVIIFVH